jgi:hypothetical protein
MPREGGLGRALWLLRHAICVVAIAALVVFLAEPLLRDGALMSKLAREDRLDVYKQLAAITATLLGFLIAAVAILVQLDVERPIVKQLRGSDAFPMLVANLLVACLALLAVTLLGLAGTFGADTAEAGRAAFERAYEFVGLAALLEFMLGGFYFAVVTYKVAAHD